MSDITRILNSEVGCRVQEYITDVANDRTLFTLPDVHHLEQSTVAFSKIENVSEYFFNEFIDLAWSDDRWVSITQGTNK